jgi:hypothetical protein
MAGMVQPGREVCELHEVAEVLDGSIPPAAFQVGDEGRAIGGQQHDVIAADRDRRARLAALHAESSGRGRTERPDEPGIEAHPGARNRRPGRLEQRERLLVAAELDADFLEDPLCMSLEARRASASSSKSS